MRSLPSVALGYGVSDERRETKDERGERRDNKFTCWHDRALLSDAEGVKDERGGSAGSPTLSRVPSKFTELVC